MTSPTEDQTPETTNQILARYRSVGKQTPPVISQEQILDRAKAIWKDDWRPWFTSPSWACRTAKENHAYFHRAKADLEAEEEKAK